MALLPVIEEKKLRTKDPREAAYFAILASQREDAFIADTLSRWKQAANPSLLDMRLAREIAYGTTQMKMALDYIAKQLAHQDKLSLKLREKVLLRMAIYQKRYMEKIPDYAISNESVNLAKKHCHQNFISFLNAILRSLIKEDIQLPQGRTVPELSIRYSYPAFLIKEWIQNYGLENAIDIMKAENTPSATMFRIRPESKRNIEREEGLEILTGTRCPVGIIKDLSRIPEIAASKEFYIQNITPACLIDTLSRDKEETPKTILDLCASPGGKLIAAHDHFPDAALWANDVSAAKLNPLSENLAKYGIPATLTTSPGEEYNSYRRFDVIILDVPCSNSGVLNKRPEARWRIDATALEHLEELQLNLIKHAATLLEPKGEIWYITCSILKRENERLVENACNLFDLEIRTQESILPTTYGWDGGFCCALRKKL